MKRVVAPSAPSKALLCAGALYRPGIGMFGAALIERRRRRRARLIGGGFRWRLFPQIDDAAAATALAIERGIQDIVDDSSEPGYERLPRQWRAEPEPADGQAPWQHAMVLLTLSSGGGMMAGGLTCAIRDAGRRKGLPQCKPWRKFSGADQTSCQS